jgi:hypothetical protein
MRGLQRAEIGDGDIGRNRRSQHRLAGGVQGHCLARAFHAFLATSVSARSERKPKMLKVWGRRNSFNVQIPFEELRGRLDY